MSIYKTNTYRITACFLEDFPAGLLHTPEVMPIKFRQKFRLYDDDGILYFEGQQIPDQDEFAPLDNFRESHGCTELRYLDKNDNTWKTL